VDSVYGNDSTGSVGGSPYLSLNTAILNLTSGKTVLIRPGNYILSSGMSIPNGSSIRGTSTQTTIIQMLNVTGDTTLVTMGENTRLEDVTMVLTSYEHHTLRGIVFPGTTSSTAKIRTCVLNVNNAYANYTGSSIVTGVEFNGTGSLVSSSSFSFNSLKGSTINVYSNGGGDKRGILVSNSNVCSTRDVNVYVAQPLNATLSSGSYVGVETKDYNTTSGSIQLRSTTIGTTIASAGQNYTGSDILQTTPSTINDPTYLSSPGIQIGPSVDLVTKTAGGKGFSSYNYPTIIYYGLKGKIKDGSGNATGAYLWPGTQAINGNTFPDPDNVNRAFFRVQQPTILCGIAATLNIPPTGSGTTLTVQYTKFSNSSLITTPFTLNFTGTQTNKTFYNSSVTLNTGDKIHVKLDYTTGAGGNSNLSEDLTIQLDLF